MDSPTRGITHPLPSPPCSDSSPRQRWQRHIGRFIGDFRFLPELSRATDSSWSRDEELPGVDTLSLPWSPSAGDRQGCHLPRDLRAEVASNPGMVGKDLKFIPFHYLAVDRDTFHRPGCSKLQVQPGLGIRNSINKIPPGLQVLMRSIPLENGSC